MLNVLYDHRPFTRLNFTPLLSTTELECSTTPPRHGPVLRSFPRHSFYLSFSSLAPSPTAPFSPFSLGSLLFSRGARFCATEDVLSNSRLIAGSSGEVKGQRRAKEGWKDTGKEGEGEWLVSSACRFERDTGRNRWCR